MRRYTVVWNAIARDQLAEIWLRKAADRAFVSSVANDVDVRLADHPEECGETLADGQVCMSVGFLRVYFRISEPDRSVEVYHIDVIGAGNGRASGR